MGQPLQRVVERGPVRWRLLCGHEVDALLSRAHFARCPDCPDEADLPPLPEPEPPRVDAAAIRAAIDGTVGQVEAAANLAAGPTLFDDYDELPEVAHARRSDPQTSYDAARSLGDLRPRQRAVLTLLRRYGSGDFATLISRYAAAHDGDPETFPEQSESGIRTRVSELVAAELVRDSGRRVRLDTGRQAVVWEPVS